MDGHIYFPLQQVRAAKKDIWELYFSFKQVLSRTPQEQAEVKHVCPSPHHTTQQHTHMYIFAVHVYNYVHCTTYLCKDAADQHQENSTTCMPAPFLITYKCWLPASLSPQQLSSSPVIHLISLQLGCFGKDALNSCRSCTWALLFSSTFPFGVGILRLKCPLLLRSCFVH